MIVPTVGRVVWYWPTLTEPLNKIDVRQPLAAIVAYVHDDHCVNLTVFDHTGMPYPRKSIYLQQEEPAPTILPYATWMPYQIAVAKGEQEPTRHATPQVQA